MLEVILKRFDMPDQLIEFEKGRFEIVTFAGKSIGRARYQPGCKWSLHVGAELGRSHCAVEHLGLVLSGCATAAFADGKIFEMAAGDTFHIPPVPHDSWVVGDQIYESLHFLGAELYARD